jgi:hypothetical protein
MGSLVTGVLLLAACGGSSTPAPTAPVNTTEGGPTATPAIAPMWPLTDPPRAVVVGSLTFSVPSTWTDRPPAPFAYLGQAFLGGGQILQVAASEDPASTDPARSAQVDAENRRRQGWTPTDPQPVASRPDMFELTSTMSSASSTAATFYRGVVAECTTTAGEAGERTCGILLDSLRPGSGGPRPNPGTRLLRTRNASLVIPADWPETPAQADVATVSNGEFSLTLTTETVTTTPEVYFDRIYRDRRSSRALTDRGPAQANGASAIGFRTSEEPPITVEERIRFVRSNPGVTTFSCGGSPEQMRQHPEICSAILDSIQPRR